MTSTSFLPSCDYFYIPVVNTNTISATGDLTLRTNGSDALIIDSSGVSQNNDLTERLVIDTSTNKLYRRSTNSYGQIYNNPINTASTSFSSAGEYTITNITDTFLSTDAVNFSVANTSQITYTGATTKIFLISYSISIRCKTEAITGAKMYINSSEVLGTEGKDTVPIETGIIYNQLSNIHGQAIRSINPGDVIEIYIANFTDTTELTAEFYSITFIEV